MERHEMLLHAMAVVKDACGNDKVALESPSRARQRVLAARNHAVTPAAMVSRCMQRLWSRMRVEVIN